MIIISIVSLFVLPFLYSIRRAGLLWAFRMPADMRPDILNEYHTDWPWIFKRIPRSLNAWLGPEPKALVGYDKGHLDVTPEGTGVITIPLYFTFRARGGWHFRFGLRYDYSDRYYNFSLPTIKRIY